MQFKPPSQPGWSPSEPEQAQQEFPLQQAPRPFIQQLQPPTQPDWQEPQYPPRPETYYPPQQSLMPPQPPPKKRMRRNDKIALWIIASLVGITVLIAISSLLLSGALNAPSTSQADQDATATSNMAATNVALEATAVAASNGATPLADTPTSQPTNVPTAIPTTPVPTFATFGDGIFQVGKDIQPGTYRTRVGSTNCYYARLKSFDTSAILSNNDTDAPAIITILKSDMAFQSENCGTWTSDLSQITNSKTSFGDGIYIVTTDIAPGNYKNTASPNCYYARLSAFDTSAIISNNDTDAVAIVIIYASDKGFESHNCGTWTKL